MREFSSDNYFPITDFATLSELITRHGKPKMLRVIHEAFPDSVNGTSPSFRPAQPALLPHTVVAQDSLTTTAHDSKEDRSIAERNEKVTDVLQVLRCMRDLIGNSKQRLEISKARQYAVDEVSEAQLRKGRFKDNRSARNTIFDACGRRLRPDIDGIVEFDKAAEDWLRRRSMRLREILLKQSNDPRRHAEVTAFFDE